MAVPSSGGPQNTSSRPTHTPSPPTSTSTTPTASSGGVFSWVSRTLTGISQTARVVGHTLVSGVVSTTVRKPQTISANLASQCEALNTLVVDGNYTQLIDNVTKYIEIPDHWFLNIFYSGEIEKESNESTEKERLSHKEFVVRKIVTMAMGNIVKATPCRQDGQRYFIDVMTTITKALEEGHTQIQAAAIKARALPKTPQEKQEACYRGLAPLLHLALPAHLKQAEESVKKASETLRILQDQKTEAEIKFTQAHENLNKVKSTLEGLGDLEDDPTRGLDMVQAARETLHSLQVQTSQADNHLKQAIENLNKAKNKTTLPNGQFDLQLVLGARTASLHGRRLLRAFLGIKYTISFSIDKKRMSIGHC